MIKKLAGFFISSAMAFALSSSTQAQTTPSVWVYYDSNHHLQYQPDTLGNHILDFSFAGYEGGVALPNLPVRVTVTPSGADDTANIQNAIKRHVLLGASEPIPPKPELPTRRQDEKTQPATVSQFVLLSLGFAFSISLIVSPIMSPPERVIFIPHTLAHRTPQKSWAARAPARMLFPRK